MIKKITLATLTILLAMAAMAQQDYCKGLKNPTSFVIGSAGNCANAQWYGFTGSKNATASQCGAWGMTGWGSQIAASQLATQSSGSSCTSSNSTDINNQQDYMNRFVIKGSGNDPLTSNHLSYLPPDNSYTSSIRLGNNCGGTHEAEMLCYQFNVRPQNSLVFIWYALSLQNGQHSVAENPEFAIEIEKKVGNNWELARYLKLKNIKPAFDYHGNVIGVTGFNAHGKKIGVCSGGAGSFAAEAQRLGCDLYVTGEADWGEKIAAENIGMPMICAGHYETETFGVKALAKAMKKALKLSTVFV